MHISSYKELMEQVRAEFIKDVEKIAKEELEKKI